MSDAAAQRRAKQTVRNLVLSLLVTSGLVAAIYLGVPRDDSNRITEVDYQAIAQSASESLGETAVSPEIPADWWANAARLESDLGVKSWYVGFVTDDNQYLGLSQVFQTNPSWESQMLAGNFLEGEVELTGLNWEIWPTLNPSAPKGTKEYALVHRVGDGVVVIYGTADTNDFEVLAKAIAAELN